MYVEHMFPWVLLDDGRTRQRKRLKIANQSHQFEISSLGMGF